MAQERVSQALERIEHAFARIEAAASHVSATGGDNNAEMDGLRQAHQALRGKVQSAIGQIDRLLKLERG